MSLLFFLLHAYIAEFILSMLAFLLLLLIFKISAYLKILLHLFIFIRLV